MGSRQALVQAGEGTDASGWMADICWYTGKNRNSQAQCALHNERRQESAGKAAPDDRRLPPRRRRYLLRRALRLQLLRPKRAARYLRQGGGAGRGGCITCQERCSPGRPCSARQGGRRHMPPSPPSHPAPLVPSNARMRTRGTNSRNAASRSACGCSIGCTAATSSSMLQRTGGVRVCWREACIFSAAVRMQASQGCCLPRPHLYPPAL